MSFFENVGRAYYKAKSKECIDQDKKYLDYCHKFNREEIEKEKREEARQDRIIDSLELIAKGMNR